MGDFDNDTAKYQALEHEMAQADAEEGREPQNYGPQPREAEQYDSGRHGMPQPPAQHQDYQQQAPQLPDQLEDPIGHFDTRMRGIENHVVGESQHRAIWDQVKNSEDTANHETYDDYNKATAFLEQAHEAKLQQQFPDTHQTALLAHSYGLQSPAHLRAAILNRDRLMVVDHAQRNGIDPAAAYYDLAKQYGYQSPIALTRSQQKRLGEIAEKGSPEEFDKAWDYYEKASRRAEGRSRR